MSAPRRQDVKHASFIRCSQRCSRRRYTRQHEKSRLHFHDSPRRHGDAGQRAEAADRPMPRSRWPPADAIRCASRQARAVAAFRRASITSPACSLQHTTDESANAADFQAAEKSHKACEQSYRVRARLSNIMPPPGAQMTRQQGTKSIAGMTPPPGRCRGAPPLPHCGFMGEKCAAMPCARASFHATNSRVVGIAFGQTAPGFLRRAQFQRAC